MIGLFDSGVGGLFIWRKLKEEFPEASTMYIADQAYAPYGEKTREEIVARATRVVRTLIQHGAQMVVVACNTATVNAIDSLRATFPDTPIVGIEPAVRLAAQASDAIVVLGTNSTVANPRYRQLVEEVAPNKQVWNIGAPELVRQVESGNVTDTTVLSQKLTQPVFEGADSLVIGCTHFSFLTPAIQRAWPQLRIFDGADGVVKRAITLADDLELGDEDHSHDTMVTTGKPTTVSFLDPAVELHHIELANQEA